MVGYPEGEDPVGRGLGPRGHALGHLLLHEEDEAGEAPGLEEAGDQGGGDVVGEVGHEEAPLGHLLPGVEEGVLEDEAHREAEKGLLQDGPQAQVLLYGRHLGPGLEEGPGQDPKPGPHLKDGPREGLGRLHDAPEVGFGDQEVLAEALVGEEPVPLKEGADALGRGELIHGGAAPRASGGRPRGPGPGTPPGPGRQ